MRLGVKVGGGEGGVDREVQGAVMVHIIRVQDSALLRHRASQWTLGPLMIDNPLLPVLRVAWPPIAGVHRMTGLDW